MEENTLSELNPEQTLDLPTHKKSLSQNPEKTPDPSSPIQKSSDTSSNSQKLIQTCALNTSKRELPQIFSIPILNKDTCNSNTYDYRSLLDTKIQKEAQRGHRIKNSQISKVPKSQQTASSGKAKAPDSSSCKLLKPELEKNSKIAKLREEKLQKELEECTFAPKILESRKKRTPEEYFQDQMKFVEKKKQKIQDKKQTILETKETEISSFSFVPAITEKSVEMASKHVYDQEIYKRLSLGCKPKPKESNPEEGGEEKAGIKEEKNELTFTPALNSRSKNMLRIGSIEDILYEDAKRRQKTKKETKLVYSYEVNVNSNSEKLLIEKFYKDFVEVHDQDTANYSEYINTLKNLHMVLEQEKNFAKENELSQRLWGKITEAEAVSSERFLMHLMAIMKYQTSIFTDSNEAISREETDYLHSIYYLFYENRTSVINHSSLNRSLKPVPGPAFRPEISENSKKILEDVSKESIIKRRELRKMEVIQEAEENCLAECTFQPVLQSTEAKIKTEEIKNPLLKEYISLSSQTAHRTNALFNFASIKKEKKEDFIRAEKEKIEERKMADCTFAPNLVKKTGRIASCNSEKEQFKKADQKPGHVPGKKSRGG